MTLDAAAQVAHSAAAGDGRSARMRRIAQVTASGRGLRGKDDQRFGVLPIVRRGAPAR
jgi:hypothetical protein